MNHPPKFQKRHYIAIAGALHSSSLSLGDHSEVVSSFVRMLKADNPAKFNPDRFRLACAQGNTITRAATQPE